MANNKIQSDIAALQARAKQQNYYCYGWYSADSEVAMTGIIPFNNVYGYCWNQDTYYYIIPEDGIYQVEFSGFSNNNNDKIKYTDFRLAILKNGNHYLLTNNGYGGATISAIVPCIAGDTLAMVLIKIGKYLFSPSIQHNQFSIFQVCPT